MTVRIFNIEVVDFKAAGAVTALADGAVEAVCAEFRALLGDAPTFEQYESARVAWRQGYAEQREGVSVAALDMAWKRFKDALGVDIKKPKATSEAATKKAAQRANAPKLETRADAEKALLEASELLADPVKRDAAKVKFSEAAKMQEKANAALARFDREEEKAAEKVAKVRRDAIVDRIKVITDVAALALIEAAIEAATGDAKARASAWSLLIAAAPADARIASNPAMRTKPAQEKKPRAAAH